MTKMEFKITMPDVNTVENVFRGATVSQIIILIGLGVLLALWAMKWVMDYVKSQISILPDMTEELKLFCREIAEKFNEVVAALNDMRVQFARLEVSKINKEDADEAICEAIKEHEHNCPMRNSCWKKEE